VSLIIVSNRVAEFGDDAPVEGGLASALSHAVRRARTERVFPFVIIQEAGRRILD
jgi:hypothetical protein